VLKRSALLSVLPKCLILLTLVDVEWLLIRWSIKSHLSLSGKCFHPYHLGRPGDRCHSWYELDEDASSCVGHLYSSGSPPLLSMASFLCSCHLSLTSRHLSMLLLPRVWMRYLDVFPDDLPEMPPDRAIEFKIELQSGTALVYKRPYPMAQNEMAELKTQLQELLDKGYI
jgi:hypothetical protein